MMIKARPVCLAFILLSFHAAAHAQFFKCKDENGRYAIQDTPCAPDANLPERKRPKPGDRDENFVQKGSRGPGSNWDPDRRATPAVGFAPPPAAPQQNAARPATGASSSQSWQEKDREYQRRRAEEEARAKKDKEEAYNRSIRCNTARQQFGLLKEDGKVYSRDNNGNRRYLDDDKRAGEVAAAKRTMDEQCR